MEIEIDEIVKEREKKVVGTQISQQLYIKLKQEAEKSFMSISDILRKIIYVYYSTERKD